MKNGASCYIPLLGREQNGGARGLLAAIGFVSRINPWEGVGLAALAARCERYDQGEAFRDVVCLDVSIPSCSASVDSPSDNRSST